MGGFSPTHLEKYGPSPEFIKSLSKHVIFDSATRSGGRELGNAGCILLASTISVAASQMSQDANPTKILYQYMAGNMFSIILPFNQILSFT